MRQASRVFLLRGDLLTRDLHLRHKTTLVWAVVAALLVSVNGPLAPAASAVVPGCDSVHPTRIGGPLYGYPDNRALNALIGVDAKNASGQKVNRDGAVITRRATHGSSTSTPSSRRKAAATRGPVGTGTTRSCGVHPPTCARSSSRSIPGSHPLVA
jgi:hypothetical protein